jgi:Tfp pilus assembly protein PilN
MAHGDCCPVYCMSRAADGGFCSVGMRTRKLSAAGKGAAQRGTAAMATLGTSLPVSAAATAAPTSAATAAAAGAGAEPQATQRPGIKFMVNAVRSQRVPLAWLQAPSTWH